MPTATVEEKYPAMHMLPGEAPEDPGDGYPLVRRLIYAQAYKFHAHYGGDLDDIIGDAHVAFLLGHRQFVDGVLPSGKAVEVPYAVQIRRWVWFSLFDAARTQFRRAAAAPMTHIEDGQDFPDRRNGFCSGLLEEDLGEDARTAARLVLDPPDEVMAEAEARGGEPRNLRSSVKAYLQASLGWSPARIREAFREVRTALG